MSDEREIEDMIEMLTKSNMFDFLTPWEVEFVESIEEWYTEKGVLTDGQEEKLYEVFDRARDKLEARYH